MFAASGFDVTGIEPDLEARKVASQYGSVLAGTAEALPEKIEGSQFSVVLLSHVLEYCIDPAAALENVKQLLAPGGTAVLEVPNCASAGFNLNGPAWFFTDVPRHRHFFTRASLDRTLEAAGFKVVRRIYQGYARQMSPDWMQAEQAIREKIGMEAGQASAWGLLARTAFSSVDAKYDSIRVHAICTQGTEEE
jgi:SAM-dependent methyltransferase